MIDAFLYGAMIAAMVEAATLGFVNSNVFQDWQAQREEEQKQTVYAFADVSADADADAPDIMIITD